MAEDQGERTEEATDARREDFRKRGQVSHSKELGGAVVLLATAGGLYGIAKFYLQNLVEMFSYSFGQNMIDLVHRGEMVEALQVAGLKIGILSIPFALAAGLIGSGSLLLQTGFLNVEDALSPDFEKLNPISGLRRIFSTRGLIEFIKSFIKLMAIGMILYLLLKSEVKQIPYLVGYSVEGILEYAGKVVVKLLFGVGGFSLVLAGADYFFQRMQLEKEMMMTKQEVKEEHKQREGDPMIKARIRRIQRDVANRRMMESVPKASVIVTNPTHIAVALKYDENLPAPQVVAKGADLIAEKIKSLAREHNIPIVENKPLARTMYKTLKIGQVIPRELFVAVAEVLSYVFKLRRKARRS